MQDLLLISDLHLGSHLKARGRGEFVHLASRIEDVFPRFIDHHLASQPPGGWQLIVNGDFIDFWNIEIGTRRDHGDEATATERLHAVFDSYPNLEDALVRFLAAGNGIVFVTGNHDAELLYPAVRRAIVERLERAAQADGEDASITRTGMVLLSELTPGRVRFVRWFLREEGGAWIEHGHKFDPSCAAPAALSPMRGGHLVQTVAEVATRGFANLMPEMDHDAPDHMSGLDYIRWAAARGVRFCFRAVLLYLKMAGKVLALWAGPGRADRAGHAQHEALMARVAENAGLQMSALMALEQMAPPPTATTVGGLLSVVWMDLILGALVPFVLVVGVVPLWGVPRLGAVALGTVASVAAFLTVRHSRKPRDVVQDMAGVAAGVGETVGVPLVLMGHSHHGTLERRGEVVYANSGSWLDGSHLVVRRDESGRLVQVSLRNWRNGGVTIVRTMEVPQPAAGPGPGPEGVDGPGDRPQATVGELSV